MELTLRAFELPLARPLETADGTITERTGIAVRVRDARGVGVGEATPLPGWTESVEACRATLSEIAASADPLAALEDGPLRTRPAARHGLSLAVADYRARRAGIPLYRHLGGEEPVRTVRANATIGDGDASTTVAVAKEAIRGGFDTLKVKVGARSVDADVARLRAVREAVGPDVEIRADANGAWSRAQARRAFEGLAALDVSYVEQPLPADDVTGHAALRGSSVGVALDETLRGKSIDEIDACIDAADVVVVKPMALGGVDRALDTARRARMAGRTAVVTTTVDAVVARTAAVHAAAALPERPACGLATGPLLETDLSRDPAPLSRGSIRVPQSPGVGTLGPWGEPHQEVRER